MEMTEKITVDLLTKDSVSILTRKFIEVDGVPQQVGQNHRCAYVNSADGRQRLCADVGEPYSTAVLAVWGDAPTVDEAGDAV